MMVFGKARRCTCLESSSGCVSYGGALRLMSEGRRFFGRRRSAFLAALNWTCLAASIVTGAVTVEPVLAGVAHTAVEAERPKRGRASD